MATYSIETILSGAFEDVKARVIAALKEQGFGILTEIDVQKTLREKLGEEIERYEILGACNPQLAYRALRTDRTLGLLLPCNVVLRETDEGVEVSILDPEKMFEIADDQTKATLGTLPGEARERLMAALTKLKGGL